MDKLALQFLCLQITEKILRMEQFLTTARTAGTRSDLEVIATFERHLFSIRKELSSATSELWGTRQEVLASSMSALLQWIQMCFHSVDELHLHLSYIHGPWTAPETPVFVEALFTPVAETKALLRNELSVIPSDVLMFEEADLATYLAPSITPPDADSRPAPTLFLPKVEINNPLQWAPLIHEMGHALAPILSEVLPSADINAIAGGDPAARQMLADWTEEIFCDALSLQLLGPAYLASFIDLITLTGSVGVLQAASQTHPPTPFRIATMFSNLERNDIVCSFEQPIDAEWPDLATFFCALFDARCRIERVHFPIEIQEAKMFSIDVPAFSEKVEARVREKLPVEKAVRGFNQNKFAYLKRRLDQNIPIGAYSAVEIDVGNTDAESSIATLRQEVAKENPAEQVLVDNLYQLRKRVMEVPCTVAEIINAGWLYKCEKIYFEALQSAPTFDADAEQVFRNRLFALDDVLKNSIETSFLHTILAKGVPMP